MSFVDWRISEHRRQKKSERITFRFSEIINKITNIVEEIMIGKEDAQPLHRLNTKLAYFAYQVLQTDLLEAVMTYDIINTSLKDLNSVGEIRMPGHTVTDQELCYIFLRLKKNTQNVKSTLEKGLQYY